MKLCLAILIAATTLYAQGTVIVTGRIIDSVTNLPVEQAAITLDQGGYHELVLTDAGGSFSFDEVPPGTATVRIRKENYLLFETTNPNDVSFEVTAEHREHNFKIVPAGTIAGRVTGDGKPEELIGVQLLREDYSAGFRQYVLYSGFLGNLSKDGLFQFTGLEPGRYLVRANPASGPMFRVNDANCTTAENGTRTCQATRLDPPKEQEEGYAVTWYPGATTLAEAVPISLSPGEKLTADFRMERRPLFHVSGKVSLPEIHGVLISPFLARSDGSGDSPIRQLSEDGEFRFSNVSPGQYVARVNVAPPSNTGFGYQAKLLVTVTDHNVEGVTLVPRPQLHLNGQFRIANADAMVPAGLSVQFGPALPAESASIDVAGNGSFVLAGFADDYSLQPAVPHGYAVTEIRYAGINYLNQLIPINGGASDPTLTIILSNQPANVSGSIDGDAKSEATIVLAPYPIPENFDLRSLRVAATDKQGAFSFQGLPPGKYKTAVLTGDNRKRFRDLTILNDKFAAADVFELTAGQSATISPKP